jgi:hypothetical protein
MSQTLQPGPYLGGFTLLKGQVKDGQCPECLTEHKPDAPHNKQSLFYQYAFMEVHGRWPTWADAMAHCTPYIQGVWIKALFDHGVVVEIPKEAEL